MSASSAAEVHTWIPGSQLSGVVGGAACDGQSHPAAHACGCGLPRRKDMCGERMREGVGPRLPSRVTTGCPCTCVRCPCTCVRFGHPRTPAAQRACWWAFGCGHNGPRHVPTLYGFVSSIAWHVWQDRRTRKERDGSPFTTVSASRSCGQAFPPRYPCPDVFCSNVQKNQWVARSS